MTLQRPLPTNSAHYVGLVSMYMANLGLTREQAEARADLQWPREVSR
jgi:hypothetical protein